MAFTTGILIGIGETPEERVDALLAIRTTHEKYGHVQEVIIQPFRVKLDIRMAQAPEPSNEDLLRTIAVARLILGGEMNIQSPPNLLSKDYPDLLTAGINDWGGVSPVTKDFINPEAAWPQISSLAERTAKAGIRPARTAGNLSGIFKAPGFRKRAAATACSGAAGRRMAMLEERATHAENSEFRMDRDSHGSSDCGGKPERRRGT